MMDKKYKVLLFSTNLGSRQAAKIREGLVQSANVSEVVSCGFIREVEPPPTFDCVCFGRILHGRYLSRFCIYPRAFMWLLFNMRKFDAVFTWTPDAAFFLYISKIFAFSKAAFIYNIRDVHRILTENNPLGRISMFVDKFVSERASLLMLTSPFYRSEYYEKMLQLKNKNFFVLENKVPKETVNLFPRDKIIAKPFDSQITLGYFGMMSYADTLFDSIKSISERGMRFYLRGHNYKGESFVEGLKAYKNIEYGGGYKNPDDMGGMFSKIDVAWAVDSDVYVPNTNEAWSLCNRFYEGLYFKKPLIVQSGTPAAYYVEKYGLGLCVDNRNPAELVEKVSKITFADIEKWRGNVERLDPSVFTLGADEYARAVESAVKNSI